MIEFLIVIVFKIITVSSFRQNDYHVIIERFSVDYNNSDYFKDLYLKYSSYNRTLKAFNMSCFLLNDLEKDIQVEVQTYKFQSNEYRLFPVVYQGNSCKIQKQDTFGTSTAHFDSNIKECPFKKGFYYIRNAYLDETKLPPFAPRGRYMLNTTLYYKANNLLGFGKVYIEIKPSNPLERIIIG